jgi:hypothetical protein
MNAIRTWALVASLAAALFGGGAIWMSKLLETRWSEGFAAGESAAAVRHNKAIEASRAAAQLALAGTNRKVIELEQSRDRLQRKLAMLSKEIGRASGNDVVCLDADLLRALSRTGVDRPDDRARPGVAD